MVIQMRSGADVEFLVRAHQDALRGYLLYLGCPAALVDDQLQETFLAFLRSGFVEQSDAATRSYLRTVARNQYLGHLRRAGQHPNTLDFDVLESVWVVYEDDDSSDWRDALRQCMDRLTERVRGILDLRYARSLSYAAIAQRLELSESGVKSVLVRARRGLRDCVERRLEA